MGIAPYVEDPDLRVVMDFNALYCDYTRDISLFLIETGLSEVDARVLRRIGDMRDGTTAAWLRWSLQMDRGQLSRSLRMLEAHRVVRLARDGPDLRCQEVRLTPEGRQTLELMDEMLQDVARLSAMKSLSVILRHRRHRSTPHALVPFQIPRLRRAD